MAALLPLGALAQSTSIQVGQGAPTPSIAEEFVQAYQRAQFYTLVATPPLTEVAAYGSGGYRQEFQDIGRTGLRFALIRPANPNYSLGVNNVVRQVRAPITAVLNRSSIGVATAGFPLIDTAEFYFVPAGSIGSQLGGSYQSFDKNFAIFVWSAPPLAGEGSEVVEMTLADSMFSKWNAVGFEAIGAPVTNATNVTSRFNSTASAQRFVNGAIYVLSSGSFSGRAVFLRRNVFELYQANQAQAGFLGLPLSDETLLPDGRRRQAFEGGTVEFTLNGVPVIKNAIQSVSITGENPVRLVAGQSYPLIAQLQTAAGELVEDREVFWTTSNGLVASVSGSGPRVTLRALRGGTAVVRATSEGKTSLSLTAYVTGICCALGEGAPTQALSQAFDDAVQRNRLTLRTPLATPLRRLGAGYIQEAILNTTGARVLIAKPDSAPLAYIVGGVLLAAFEGSGGVAGALGYPLGDASAGGSQLFEGGALAGAPVRVVNGPILTRWRALGMELGALGPPLGVAASVLTFTGNTVFVQRFASGIILNIATGSLAGRAFVLTGAFAGKYAELAGAAGLAGAPLSDEFQVAGLLRQEFEGATFEIFPGQSVRVIEKARKPAISVSPSSLLPGGRYRVSIGGFSTGTRLRITQSGATTDSFEATAATGAYAYESVVPANSRLGLVVLRATEATNAQSFAETTFSVRTLAELRPQLSKFAGDQQSGAPATVLASPVQVRLLDASGNPLSNIAVRFEASPGGAIISSDPVTNGDGLAQAVWRLPSQAGIALLSVQAAGQTATFSARATAVALSGFPLLSQAVEGTLGNTGELLRRKGSLLASMAAVVRFYQLRGVVPQDNGLANISDLNNFLRSYCTVSISGQQLCDGFIYAGPGSDPVPNPLRLHAYSSGVLDFEAIPAQLDFVRQSVFDGVPVILALELTRAGQAPASHFVAATGIDANGEVQVVDSHPDFARSTLSQYANSLNAAGQSWQVKWTSAFRFVPRGSQRSAFFLHGNAALRVSSAAPSCQPLLSWPSTYADSQSNADSGTFHLINCDGDGRAYQVDVPARFLLTFTVNTNPIRQSVVSGAAEASYGISDESGAWVLRPMTIQATADAVLNAASFQPQIAPGSIVSIFGAGLPKGKDAEDAVEWNGRALPIFFSNGFQLNTALPEAPAGTSSIRLTSRFGSQSLPIETLPYAPAIFVLSSGSPAILNQDGTLNSTSSPAARGQVITMFGTGFGETVPGSNNLRNIATAPRVQIQGVELHPQFAGLAPGFVGLYQLNVLLPNSLTPALNQEVLVRQGDVPSPIFRFSLR